MVNLDPSALIVYKLCGNECKLKEEIVGIFKVWASLLKLVSRYDRDRYSKKKDKNSGSDTGLSSRVIRVLISFRRAEI